MRLVLGLLQDNLHGADDAGVVFSNQQRPCAPRRILGHPAPEIFGAGDCQRMHETHRRSARHAVNQDISKFADLRFRQRCDAANAPAA